MNRGLINHLLEKGVVVGIKTDNGLVPISESCNEQMTQGIDTLLERSKDYYDAGARFAKFRCVIDIDIETDRPSDLAIEKNAEILAEYADISIQAGLVPIIEPEVLMTNCPDIEVSEKVTENILTLVYIKLDDKGVDLSKTMLKPNMVRFTKSGDYTEQELDDISNRTFGVLRRSVPLRVPGIVFLSGGMSENDSTVALDKINKLANQSNEQLWRISFSYGRTLQQSALKQWVGDSDNVEKAQQKFIEMAKQNSSASMGSL